MHSKQRAALRTQRLRYGILVVLIAATTLPLSSCFLRALLGGEIINDISDSVDAIFAAIRSDASTSICSESEPGVTECIYIIEGQSEATTASLISELGVTGVLIDPIVLVLPADVTDFAGSYEDGDGNTGDLIVYSGLSVVPADDTRNFVAGPGEQLVVVELPPGAPIEGVNYLFDVSFQREVPTGTPPTEIKAFFTGRTEFNGKAYYPPLYPCTTDTTSVPTVALARVASLDVLEAITLPTDQPVCDQELYFYFAAESTANPCDLDNNTLVDIDDLALIMNARNLPTSPGDPRDANDDGRIDANDARACTSECLLPQCARFVP